MDCRSARDAVQPLLAAVAQRRVQALRQPAPVPGRVLVRDQVLALDWASAMPQVQDAQRARQRQQPVLAPRACLAEELQR